MAYRQLYETSRPCSALAYRKRFPVVWKAVLSFIYQGACSLLGSTMPWSFGCLPDSDGQKETREGKRQANDGLCIYTHCNH